MGLVHIIEFVEVVPEVYFIRSGSRSERHDFTLTKRFPDKYHKTAAYANGIFNVFKDRYVE